MNDTEIKKRAIEEKKRIIEILDDVGLSEKRKKMMEPVIENTSWMKAKLDDTMVAIKNAQVVITYDNGGNQKGLRINPLFKGYESLWKSYMQGMDRILNCLPAEQIEIQTQVVEKPQTILELVRDKHKKEA